MVDVFSGFSMRFVEEDTEASGVCVVLLMLTVDRPPLARDFGWLVGSGGG